MSKMAVSENGLESKRLKVNMGKTNIMISGRDIHTFQTSGKYPCAVCRIMILGVEGVLVIQEQFLEDLLRSVTCWWQAWCNWQFCDLATIKRCCSAWGKFRELLPSLTCKAISLNTRGQMHNSCVRGTMLYSSKLWTLR